MSDGPMVIGLSEHVTYWDSLGWKDPYGSSVFSERQSNYANRFRLDSVYTPQIVVNGAEQVLGSDRGQLQRAIQAQLGEAATAVIAIASGYVAGGTAMVEFSVTGSAPAGSADLFVAIADDVDLTKVERGENRGRTLTHVAVTRALKRVATLQPNRKEVAQLNLPTSFRTLQQHHVVVFAQSRQNGRVLGIATMPLLTR